MVRCPFVLVIVGIVRSVLYALGGVFVHLWSKYMLAFCYMQIVWPLRPKRVCSRIRSADLVNLVSTHMRHMCVCVCVVSQCLCKHCLAYICIAIFCTYVGQVLTVGVGNSIHNCPEFVFDALLCIVSTSCQIRTPSGGGESAVLPHPD